jgi:hypothetical protein
MFAEVTKGSISDWLGISYGPKPSPRFVFKSNDWLVKILAEVLVGC